MSRPGRLPYRATWAAPSPAGKRRTSRCGGPDDGDVLHDADASLASWLASVLPSGTKISFDAPESGWADGPPDPPLVDAFLYDIREDEEGRPVGWAPIRDGDGRTIARQQAPRRYVLYYLVTAWTAGHEAPSAEAGDLPARGGPAPAEHEMLGALLSACAGLDTLPAECLRGSLAEAGLPMLLRCAPAGRDTDPGRWWAGFGLPPRVFLDLRLVVPVVPVPDRDVASPTREIALDVSKPGVGGEEGLAPRRRPTGGPGRRWERSGISEHTVRPGW